jgi:tripartite ATP-independent transporter DctP family solute receptor
MKKTLLMVMSITMALVFLLAGCGGSDSSTSGDSKSPGKSNQTLTIRYGSADAKDAAVVQGIFAFKDYVEKASNGSIKVEPHINGVLGGDRELCEALQLGTVDMTVVMGGILANYDEVFNIFSMPYLFESKQASYDAVDGEFGKVLAKKIEDINFKLVGWGDGGTYQVANSTKPITSVEDMRGISLRVPEISADIDFFKALGAAPTPISFAETYTALEQGVVDGLELPVELMYCSKLMEPVTYLTLTGHSESIFPALMSMDLWNKLTEEQRKIIMEGMEVQVQKNREVALQGEEEYMQAFKDMGGSIYKLTDEERQKFIKVGDQIQQKYVSSIGADLLELAKSYN